LNKTDIFAEIPGVYSEISSIITILKEGGSIIYPTDSIWGLGCDATNETAVEKIYAIKNRKKNLPMIVLLHDENQLFDYVKEIPDVAFDLFEMSNKPLTIIFENGKNVAKSLLAKDGSIAIRICKDESCLSLLRKWRKPLVSTSSNVSGKAFARTFEEIDSKIVDQVDGVFNKGFNSRGSKASQIIKLNTDGQFSIIRK
jgi:L-threonylcarbamoyladenylate synthase